MSLLKKRTKSLFRVTGTLFILDRLNYFLAKAGHYSANRRFKKAHPGFALPPDYFLYETYKLDYAEYREDGEGTAREILEWTAHYLPPVITVLEWGCGVARVVRHLPALANKDSGIYACDINAKMIEWDKTHIPDVEFQVVDYLPPTNYPPGKFDLVFALSVFTHIERDQQEAWLKEISRVLKPGGIFLFTTHGAYFRDKLETASLRALDREGAYTVTYGQKGHRMMSTYNVAGDFKKRVEQYFSIEEFYAGHEHVNKTGGQDLWIVKKEHLFQS